MVQPFPGRALPVVPSRRCRADGQGSHQEVEGKQDTLSEHHCCATLCKHTMTGTPGVGVYGHLRTFWRCVCPACLSAMLGPLKLLSPLQEGLGQQRTLLSSPLLGPGRVTPQSVGSQVQCGHGPAPLPLHPWLRRCPLAQRVLTGPAVPPVRPNPTPTAGSLQDGSEDLVSGASQGKPLRPGRGGHSCRLQAFPVTIEGGSTPHRRMSADPHAGLQQGFCPRNTELQGLRKAPQDTHGRGILPPAPREACSGLLLTQPDHLLSQRRDGEQTGLHGSRRSGSPKAWSDCPHPRARKIHAQAPLPTHAGLCWSIETFSQLRGSWFPTNVLVLCGSAPKYKIAVKAHNPSTQAQPAVLPRAAFQRPAPRLCRHVLIHDGI